MLCAQRCTATFLSNYSVLELWSWARGFGWEKRVPSSWGGYGLAGEVEVEVRCEVGAVVLSRAIANRRTDK